MNFFRLSFRMLRRDWTAGELNVLAFALIIAVSGMTTVSFFSDRVQIALSQKSNQLLGADLLVISDQPIPELFSTEAKQRNLKTANTTKFHSMISNGDENLLVDIKVVSEGYPLRGTLHLASDLYQSDSILETHITESIPEPGTAWVDEKLMARLAINKGDIIDVGALQLTVAELVMSEPDSSVIFMAIHPRVLINESDLPATELVQEGSRIKYHLMIAGDPGQVESYRKWVEPQLEYGQRVEGIRDARPEIKSALERAEKFLSLAALASVVLAAAAISLAVRRFIQRHLDGCAVMRSMGASQSNLLNLYLTYFIALGFIASIVGCLFGFVAQEFLARWLSGLVGTALPWPSWLPAIHGLLIGVVLLLGFALPPLLNLRSVPALRVLRRDIGTPNAQSLSAYILGIIVLSLLFIWKTNDLRLGLYVIGGFIAAIIVFGLLGYLLVSVLSGMRHQTGSAWRYGLASIKRRSISSLVQTIALGLGIMALLVLSVIRDDLVQEWKASLPADAPNQFIINIQSDQLQALEDFFIEHDVEQPELFPMVRGRLTQINEVVITADTFSDLRAERLARREFNMSWADELPQDNKILAGDWWGENDADKTVISLEEGIAKTLGIEIGDELTYEVAGSNFTATVTSLRKVDWETFQVNFFVVTPPGLIENYPASYITSFHLPPSRNDVMHEMVRTFPNFLVVDLAIVIEQVQMMISQVSKAIEFVFMFTLLAGLAVLYAAIASTQDERIYEAAIFRSLGAKRKQLTRTWATEFAILGGLAGIFAAAGASVLSFVIVHYVLHLDYLFNPWIWFAGFLSGAIGVTLVGLIGTRSTLSTPPLLTLRKAG